MATKNLAVLAAGTKCECSYDGGGTFKEVTGFTAIGNIGEQAETQETTTLEDKVRTYIAALSTPADKEFTGNHYAGDANQKEFINAAKTRQYVIFRVTLPGTPKQVGINEIQLLGFQFNEPTAEGVLTFTVNGKASGVTVWGTDTTVDVDSLILSSSMAQVAVGGTMQLTATIYPENASDKSVTYTSSSDAIAKVSATGVVTGVKAGSFMITATTANGVKSFITAQVVAA